MQLFLILSEIKLIHCICLVISPISINSLVCMMEKRRFLWRRCEF